MAASTLMVAQLLLAVGLAAQQLDKSSPQQQLPRLDTATEKGLSVCTRVLKGASVPDDQAWYTYFSCVEKELFKHKVVSELCLTINYNFMPMSDSLTLRCLLIFNFRLARSLSDAAATGVKLNV